MTDIELLADALHEIRTLRRVNEILQAKVEVMDLFACVLHTDAAHRSQGQSIDIAWKLERKIERIQAAEAAEKGANEKLGS